MPYENAIAALADPTRRAIVERLRNGPLPVCVIAAALPISRPAVSQHLRVLSEAGLLTVSPEGARRLYAIAPEGVAELRRWLDEVWDDALSAFATEATRMAASKRMDGEQT